MLGYMGSLFLKSIEILDLFFVVIQGIAFTDSKSPWKRYLKLKSDEHLGSQ